MNVYYLAKLMEPSRAQLSVVFPSIVVDHPAHGFIELELVANSENLLELKAEKIHRADDTFMFEKGREFYRVGQTELSLYEIAKAVDEWIMRAAKGLSFAENCEIFMRHLLIFLIDRHGEIDKTISLERFRRDPCQAVEFAIDVMKFDYSLKFILSEEVS